jgi:hypothetical protein
MQTEMLFDSLHQANRATSPSVMTSSLNANVRDLGALPLGRSASASGNVGNGMTDTYRFTVSDRGRNTLTLDNKINGSLESVRIVDELGNLSTDGAINTRGSSTSVSGNGQIFSTFSGIQPGTYFLRFKGAATDNNVYSFRLNYQPTRADSNSATDFSGVLNRSSIDFSNVSIDSGD